MRFTFVILLFLSLGADAQMIIKAHPNYRPYAVASANLLLDDYPNAVAAYSLRKLDKDYTGSAIRVRRSNDNTEQDIGFTSAGDLDTASLKTFVGANSGFVTTWYDQSGNARNATQATVANQPLIVFNGVIIRRSGDIVLKFTDDFLETSGTSGINISPTSYSYVGTRDTSSNTIKTIFSTGILANLRGYGALYRNDGGANTQDSLRLQVRFAAATPRAHGNYQNTTRVNHLLFGVITTSAYNTWFNGSDNRNVTYTEANATTSTNLIIGSRRDDLNNMGNYLDGSISELIIWQSDRTTERTGIESNINSYYGIY
jgi:hypothetical protein